VSRSPHGDVVLELFEPSAKDGTPIHRMDVPPAFPLIQTPGAGYNPPCFPR
jgi:hypothetical protein